MRIKYSKRAIRNLADDVTKRSRALEAAAVVGGSVETQRARCTQAAYDDAVNNGIDRDVADCFFGRC